MPTKYIHKPWEMPRSVQESSGCVIGVDYPNPVSRPRAWETYAEGGKSKKGGKNKKKSYRGYYPEKGKGKGGGKSNFEMYG